MEQTYQKILQELRDAAQLFSYQFDSNDNAKPMDERRGGFDYENADEFEGIDPKDINAIRDYLQKLPDNMKKELIHHISDYISNVYYYQKIYPFENGYSLNDDINILENMINAHFNKEKQRILYQRQIKIAFTLEGFELFRAFLTMNVSQENFQKIIDDCLLNDETGQKQFLLEYSSFYKDDDVYSGIIAAIKDIEVESGSSPFLLCALREEPGDKLYFWRFH